MTNKLPVIASYSNLEHLTIVHEGEDDVRMRHTWLTNAIMAKFWNLIVQFVKLASLFNRDSSLRSFRVV